MKSALISKLKELDGVSVDTWKDTELVCVFYRGKEFAHFHSDNILDMRLTPTIIREENLTRSVSARIHPDRSPNSRWIGVEFRTQSDLQNVLHLVGRACKEMA